MVEGFPANRREAILAFHFADRVKAELLQELLVALGRSRTHKTSRVPSCFDDEGGGGPPGRQSGNGHSDEAFQSASHVPSI